MYIDLTYLKLIFRIYSHLIAKDTVSALFSKYFFRSKIVVIYIVYLKLSQLLL
jgi:hypothetical protein